MLNFLSRLLGLGPEAHKPAPVTFFDPDTGKIECLVVDETSITVENFKGALNDLPSNWVICPYTSEKFAIFNENK